MVIEKGTAKNKKCDYTSAGHLSYYILWGASTNRNTNIKQYKKMFKLN